jgi:hypothetical protein
MSQWHLKKYTTRYSETLVRTRVQIHTASLPKQLESSNVFSTLSYILVGKVEPDIILSPKLSEMYRCKCWRHSTLIYDTRVLTFATTVWFVKPCKSRHTSSGNSKYIYEQTVVRGTAWRVVTTTVHQMFKATKSDEIGSFNIFNMNVRD